MHKAHNKFTGCNQRAGSTTRQYKKWRKKYNKTMRLSRRRNRG
jgi:hypothetical protein